MSQGIKKLKSFCNQCSSGELQMLFQISSCQKKRTSPDDELIHLTMIAFYKYQLNGKLHYCTSCSITTIRKQWPQLLDWNLYAPISALTENSVHHRQYDSPYLLKHCTHDYKKCDWKTVTKDHSEWHNCIIANPTVQLLENATAVSFVQQTGNA